MSFAFRAIERWLRKTYNSASDEQRSSQWCRRRSKKVRFHETYGKKKRRGQEACARLGNHHVGKMTGQKKGRARPEIRGGSNLKEMSHKRERGCAGENRMRDSVRGAKAGGTPKQTIQIKRRNEGEKDYGQRKILPPVGQLRKSRGNTGAGNFLGN